MTPQTRISLTNSISIAAIILTIGGSATLLYSAVVSNKVSQDKTNEMVTLQIEDLHKTDERVIAQEQRLEGLLIDIRERQIRMEEHQKRGR